MERYDVIVIGGGPGGYVAAIKAAQAGLRTAVVEKEKLGGVCLNWGCIPTKSLLRNAEIVRSLSEGDKYGFSVENVQTDYQSAFKRSRAVSARLVKGIGYLMKKNNIKVYSDFARFMAPGVLSLRDSGEQIGYNNVIIAAGSTPATLPFIDYSKKNILTSKGALQLEKAPESIIIIGAGAIGMEFATVFRAYGAEVHIVEMMPHVLPNEDADVSAAVEKEMKGKGFDIHTGTKLLKVDNDGKTVTAQFEKDGKQFEISSEMMLVAAGIRPNTSELNLDAVNVRVNERGYIPVDDCMFTGTPGVFAIGDVTGKLALAHTASAQGEIAVKRISGKPSNVLSYVNIPKCTYTSPEVASCGLTLKKAEAEGFSAAEAVFPLSANGKSIAYGEDAGFVKLVYDRKFGQLLGAHMAGAHVTEMIWGIVGYLGIEMTVDEMAEVVHPHPTVSEAIMEAALIASGHPVHI